MLISRFHDVYDLFFAEICQYPMEFLSAAVAFELIDPEHLRKLHRFAIPDIAEKADNGGDGQSKLAGDRGIGTAVPQPVDQGKDGSLGHALVFRKEAVWLCEAFPAGASVPALAQNKDNRLFEGGKLLDALHTVIVNLIRHLSASGAHTLFSRLLNKDLIIFFRVIDLFNRNPLQSE